MSRRIEAAYQIDAPHYCAGFTVRQGKVFYPAPILNWMKGKTLIFVTSYCQQKGYKVTKVR